MRLLDDVHLRGSEILANTRAWLESRHPYTRSLSRFEVFWFNNLVWRIGTVLLYESMICGHHIYKNVWSLILGEIMSVDREHRNLYDRHAICLLKGGSIVGHAHRELAKHFRFFLGHGGTITCEVTGSRKYGKGLKVPCTYMLLARKRISWSWKNSFGRV